MIGESLGPYKILAPLGAGGMGEVYVSEMRVTRSDDGGSVVVWSTQFEGIDDGSGAGPDEAMSKEIVGEVVKAGLDNLQVILDG